MRRTQGLNRSIDGGDRGSQLGRLLGMFSRVVVVTPGGGGAHSENNGKNTEEGP